MARTVSGARHSCDARLFHGVGFEVAVLACWPIRLGERRSLDRGRRVSRPCDTPGAEPGGQMALDDTDRKIIDALRARHVRQSR